MNVNLFRHVLRDLTQWNEQGIGVEFGLIGNKAGPFFRSIGAEIKAVMGNVGEQPALAELIGGIKVMIDAYENGEIDRLFLASNEFVNTMTQQPRVSQLLPLDPEDSLSLIHISEPTRRS